MNIYHQKVRWKWILAAIAVAIVGISLWYTNILVQKIARDERGKVKIWADAIQRKAKLVQYTDNFFQVVKKEERKRVELLADVYKKLIQTSNSEDLTFYLKIMSDNTTIPIIITDGDYAIQLARNTDFDQDTVKYLSGKLLKEYTQYPPIRHSQYGIVNYIFYKESNIYTELRLVLNDILKSFISEVVENTASVPVLITDESKKEILAAGNFDTTNLSKSQILQKTLAEIEKENPPIKIELSGIGTSYIFYKESYLLTQMRYFPYILLGVIGLFLLISYTLFSTARSTEQNQVWLGMSKETAHQLGTPLSSLLAWLEILKDKPVEKEILDEIGKDITRLETITQRFSKIGSEPVLERLDLIEVITTVVSYLRIRSPRKTTYELNFPLNRKVILPLNRYLFEWVIENLCKNAIDAMSGDGTITIELFEDDQNVFIDVSDTGKGIPKSKFNTIFKPGYTSKKRGWGLGLSLAKRIVNEYHKGVIYVKISIPGKGTTFRIVLKK